MKYLGIDYGKSRIGVAVSDALGITARGLETIRWNGKNWDFVRKRLMELFHEQQAEAWVLGLPRRTDGRMSESEEAACFLADLLEEDSGVRPIFFDERYTTVLASRVLNETGYKKTKKRDVIDQVAAEILLQEFLEVQRRSTVL